MPLALTEEQTDLAAAVAEFAARHAPIAATRESLALLAAGGRPRHWDELVKNGLHGLHLPEEHGGQGGELADTAVAVEELGRSLLPGPYLPTVLASAAALGAADCKARTTALEAFAEGATGALVLPTAGVIAAPTEEGWELTGASGPVLGLLSAELLVVGFETGAGTAWAVLDAAQPGLRRRAGKPVDLTRDAGTLDLDRAKVPHGAMLDGLDADHVNLVHAGLLAAESAGIMRWAVDAAVDYARIREQFGKPIGSFQAVKHKCATMLISAELAAAAAWSAVASVDQDAEQRRLAAGCAAVVALGSAVDTITEAITVFGGIGFTWEHDAHLFWRRAISIAAMGGPVAAWTTAVGEASVDSVRSMEVELPDEDPSFRARIGALLDTAATLGDDDGTGPFDVRGARRTFLAEHGLAAPHWPAPYGMDASPSEQIIVAQEFARRGIAQPTSVIGEWAMPTVLAFGTEQQKEKFALPTLRGELIWCQLFSEPGAGSDLAALSTKARKVDGGWQLDGQKVWTSGAHQADWGICLARTDPDAPKHKGLSYFLVDMRSAGIDIRPLKQATGEAEFNEVFLDAVFVPDEGLLGEPGQGWRITATTLQNERSSISAGLSAGAEESLRDIVRAGAHAATPDQALRALGHVSAFSEAIGAMNLRETLRRINGMQPGAGSSLAKVAHARLAREAAATSVDVLGTAAMFEDAPFDAVASQLAVPAQLIGGGTVEIQLNVIAERILRLPRD